MKRNAAAAILMEAPSKRPKNDPTTFDTALKEYIDDYIKTHKVPFGEVGYITYKRTYARRKDPSDSKSETEEFHETLFRILLGCQRQLHMGLSLEDAKQMFRDLYNLKCSVAGRFLWQLGCGTVDKLGMFSLQNCAATTVDNISAFTWEMEALMLGCGVGLNVQNKYISQLPNVKNVTITRQDTNDADFIVPDSREGWVKLLEKVLKAHFYTGKGFSYSTVLIRSKGEVIKTFGGVASGPVELCKGVTDIHELLNRRAQDPLPRLNSVDCVDLATILGRIVVSGNVRRCISEDELVHTTEGLIPIKNIKPGMKTITANGSAEISELIYQGKQSVIAIKLQIGELKCTPKHRVAVMVSPGKYDWKQARELIPGDRLVFSDHIVPGVETELPSFKYIKPKHSTTCKDIKIPKLTTDVAWFFGLFFGDGYVYPNFKKNGFNAYISVACDPNQKELIKTCQNVIESFGVNLCDVYPKTNDNCYKVRAQSKQLAWYMAKFKTANEEMNVPDFILRGKPKIRASFLAGLFDADGSCKTRPLNLVASIYPEFTKQVQALYASLGIETRYKLSRKAKGNWKNLYTLNLVGEKFINKFKELVGIYSYKYVHKENIIAQFDYGYPKDWLNDMPNKLFRETWNRTSKQMIVSKYEKITGEKQKLIPIEVLSIKDNNEIVETYDISVPETNEFVVGPGLLVHNSAIIIIGDAQDREFLRAKRWDLGSVPNNRAYANLSVACDDLSELPEEFWEGYRGNGECYGLVNLRLSRMCGRIGDIQYPDHDIIGYNPCVTGDTMVTTVKGQQSVSELIGRRVSIVIDGAIYQTTDAGFFETGVRRVYRLLTTTGHTLMATGNHKIMTITGWKELRNLTRGDKIWLNKTAPKEERQVTIVEAVIDESRSERVYDCTVPGISAFSANGIYVHNCSEQSLANRETCCLGEVFLPNCRTREEFQRCVQEIYRICKHSLSIKCHIPESAAVIHKNMRMGIGITGYAQATPEQLSWLSDSYGTLRKFDINYSRKHDWPVSRKVTTAKPSGTLSLLPGVTPGCHPGYSEYYIRRIRFASNSPLIEVCRQHGYHVEYQEKFDGTRDHTTMVISFPCKFPEHTVTEKDVTAIDQLETIKSIQTDWSDNAVSNTVYFHKGDVPKIQRWLERNYRDNIKSVSFLLHSGHGFKQAPLEEITEEQYHKFKRGTRPIECISIGLPDEDDEQYVGEGECPGGKCPIK